MCVVVNQKSAYERRMSAWSSDVCSADLQGTRTTRLADGVRDGTQAIGSAMAAIGDAVGDIASKATSIASDAARISDSSSDFQTTIEQLSAAVDRSSGTLTEARDQIGRAHV